MAHYAKIENNIVTNVIVAEQDFIESGAAGDPTTWVQTSYNSTIRENYAGIGYVYFPDLDMFVPPKTFESWILDEVNGKWDAPTQKPDGDKNYIWNEESLSWIESASVLPSGEDSISVIQSSSVLPSGE
jgi:hypothetical protein